MGSAIKTLRYVYDSRGNRKALIDQDGGRFTYTYDALSRITQVRNPQGDRTSYSYDDAGRRTLKKLANGTRASFSYDDDGNLTKLYNLKSDGTVLSSFEYAYDKVGNRTSVAEADGSRVTWSYDNAYQLTGEHRTGTSGYRDTYTYDPSGNRLLKIHDGARTTYAYDAANQLTYSQDASGRTTYTFDADGNQQVVRAPSGDRTTYVWDYENRMTSVRLPSGVRNTMAYDADGLRVKLEESTGTKKFVWDDQNYLAETDAANDTQVVYTNEPRRYGNLISQRRGSTSHWYHFDAIGSTRELTNASAVITDTRLYDAWGSVLSWSGTTSIRFGFIGSLGYCADEPANSHYVRARHYESRLSRWMSLDPVPFWIGRVDGFNLVTYVRNRPTVLRDASGLLTIIPVPGRQSLGRVACGATPFIEWTFRLDFTNPDTGAVGAPCDGWIVQRVTVTCGYYACDQLRPCVAGPGGDDRGWPSPPQQLTYYEAWPVEQGKRHFIQQEAGKARYTDRASYQFPDDTFGLYEQIGAVTFFCKKASEDPSGAAVGIGELTSWKDGGKRYLSGSCETSPGQLTSTVRDVAFFKEFSVEGQEYRKFEVTWDCCQNAFGGAHGHATASPSEVDES